MLRLNDVTIARGTRILYEHATAVADAADRVGLVGENGCGKSSLFAAILGELAPEAGTIDAPPLERISHVAQSVVETDEEALAYVLSGHAPLMAAKKEAEEAAESGDAMREAAALAQLAEVNEGARPAVHRLWQPHPAGAFFQCAAFRKRSSCRRSAQAFRFQSPRWCWWPDPETHGRG